MCMQVKQRYAKLTRAERWQLECLLNVPLCVPTITRKSLLRRRLVRLDKQKCDLHCGARFVAITRKGRRALGRGFIRLR